MPLQEEYRARALPIDVWFDEARLRPGEQWDESIRKALLDSFGLLIFVSLASVSSKWGFDSSSLRILFLFRAKQEMPTERRWV
jgi:hypothetical protein